MIKLINGDCTKELSKIESGSVDLVLTDPPYGVTDAEWDKNIDIEWFMSEIFRVLKPGGNAAIFGTEPFSSHLRLSRERSFKFDLIWDKKSTGNPLLSQKQPLKTHEIITVFSKDLLNINPEELKTTRKYMMEKLKESGLTKKRINEILGNVMSGHYFTYSPQFCIPSFENWKKLDEVGFWGNDTFEYLQNIYNSETVNLEQSACKSYFFNPGDIRQTQIKNPMNSDLFSIQKSDYIKKTGFTKSIIECSRESGYHPTQKPLPLLVKIMDMLCPKGGLVLDMYQGSGSTGCAAKKTGRSYIGIEKEERFHEIAKRRIEETEEDL